MSDDRITFRDDLDQLEDDQTIVEDPDIRRAKTVLFLAAILAGVVVIAVLLLFFQPEGQVMTTSWPNGYRRTSTTYVTGSRHPDAAPHPATERPGLMEQGPHRAWHENGQLAEEGRFEEGFRVGEWRFWDEAGRLDEARSGTYVRDVRSEGE